ncbi:MAG: hypothetical protein R3D27_08915 [Hyphomicrobiaceae bacterium]
MNDSLSISGALPTCVACQGSKRQPAPAAFEATGIDEIAQTVAIAAARRVGKVEAACMTMIMSLSTDGERTRASQAGLPEFFIRNPRAK